MTTIAWDGKTLATDSQRTSGDIVESDDEKKLYVDIGGYLAVAGCGDLMGSEEIFNWIKSNKVDQFPKIDSKDVSSVICIKKDRSVLIYRHDGHGRSISHRGILADGSGWEIALGAMDAGATAVEAVEIAIKRDINSGGKVQSYTFEG